MNGAVVIGIGNAYRRDDGVGHAAVALLDGALPATDVVLADGEPTRLIDAWAGRRLAIVVDAIRSGCEAGHIHRLELGVDPLPAPSAQASTHGPGLEGAVELGRALGLLPEKLIVYGIEAASVSHGTGLSPAVASAMPNLIRRISSEVLSTCA